MSDEPKCSAHGNRRCTWCSLNPASCGDLLGRGECSAYAQDGMHWDTCPNRVSGIARAGALGVELPPLREGGPFVCHDPDCKVPTARHWHEGDVTTFPIKGEAAPLDRAPREGVLSEASTLITGDRNQTYGSPTQNFTDTANVWNTILRRKLKDGESIQPGEVAAMMVGLKLVRMVAQPKRDNWVDIAGYAGCGYEADLSTGRVTD